MLAAILLMLSACSSNSDGSVSAQPAETSASPVSSPTVDSSAASTPETDQTEAIPETTQAMDPSLTGSSDPTGTSDRADGAADYRGDLDAIVSDFVGDVPGGVVTLVRHTDETTVIADGMSTQTDPMMAGTIFRADNVSKMLVAAMVMQLVDEQRIELDEPLAHYLPDTPIGGAITIEQLLSHQSGIPNYTDRPIFFTEVLTTPDRAFTPSEIVDMVVGMPLGETGSFAYSNTNYILLGQLIEEMDQTDLNTALAARITTRTGMTATSFSDTGQASPHGVAGGWSAGLFDGDAQSKYRSLGSSAWAAGALLSTADDLAIFLDALLIGGLVSEESLALMTRRTTSGYGLGLAAFPLGINQTGFGHGGRIPGFTSMMAIDPETGTIVIVLTNNDDLVADELLTSVIESLPE